MTTSIPNKIKFFRNLSLQRLEPLCPCCSQPLPEPKVYLSPASRALWNIFYDRFMAGDNRAFSRHELVLLLYKKEGSRSAKIIDTQLSSLRVQLNGTYWTIGGFRDNLCKLRDLRATGVARAS